MCGGPNYWTLVRGEVWVSCVAECEEQLEIPGLPPLIAKGDEFDAIHWPPELEEKGRVVPSVGGAAPETHRHGDQLSFKLLGG